MESEEGGERGVVKNKIIITLGCKNIFYIYKYMMYELPSAMAKTLPCAFSFVKIYFLITSNI